MTLSVALIGAGYFAGLHAEAWHRNPDTRLAGIADLDAEKARDLAARTTGDGGAIAIADDPARLLADLDPDIVDIAAPPDAHLAMIRLALGGNARAVVCQKPFCDTLQGAREAVRLADEAGRLLIVHENFRFQPWYRALRNALHAGCIGEVYQLTFRLRPGDGQGTDAYLARQPYFQRMERFLVHETAIHWIDTFRFLMGEPEAVFADLRRLNPVILGEDAGVILFRHPGGRRALFDGNRLADHAADDPRLTMGECLAEGSDGTIALDGFGRLSLRHRGETGTRVIGEDWPRDTFGGDCVYALQRHVSDHLLHDGPVENTARAYLRNLEIEEAVYDSAASGRVVGLEGA